MHKFNFRLCVFDLTFFCLLLFLYIRVSSNEQVYLSGLTQIQERLCFALVKLLNWSWFGFYWVSAAHLSVAVGADRTGRSCSHSSWRALH